HEAPPYSGQEFQKALAHALVRSRPKRPLFDRFDRLLSGLPKLPPDFSEGYQEGQRNNECARRAGSCLAKGMNVEETFEECCRWDREHNQPPLGETEVRSCVNSVARTHARRGAEKFGKEEVTEGPSHVEGCEFIFDGDAPVEPSRMLIKGLLPASGIAF